MAKKSRGRGPTKVLFVGNSFTARNDLPGLVARRTARLRSRQRHLRRGEGGAQGPAAGLATADPSRGYREELEHFAYCIRHGDVSNYHADKDH